MANQHQKIKWPCESTRSISVSIDGFELVNITLPFPVLLPSSTLFPVVLPRKGGIVEVVLEKALYDLWPEDLIEDRWRWNAEKLATWTEEIALNLHLKFQFFEDHIENKLQLLFQPLEENGTG